MECQRKKRVLVLEDHDPVQGRTKDRFMNELFLHGNGDEK